MRVSSGWWLVFGVDERFVEDERGVLEARLEVAVRPLVGRALPIGSLPVLGRRRSPPSVHFSSCDLGRAADRRRRARLPAWRGGGAPDASRRCPRVRAFGPPGRRLSSGSTDERQRLELDLDLLDRFGRGQLVDRGDRENRLALVDRLHRSGRARSARWPGSPAPRSVTPSAGAGRSSAVRIAFTPGIASAALASMLRTRACGIGLSSSFANSMPSARIVLGVLRLARHLRDEVGRRVVLADQFVLVVCQPWLRPPHQFRAAHQRGENLVVVLAAAQIARDAVRQFLRASDSDSSSG